MDSTASKAAKWLRENHRGRWEYVPDRDKFLVDGEWLTPEMVLNRARR